VRRLWDISRQIRARRRELGLSLSQLARRVDTSPATLSRYEGGWTRFEIYTLRKLATALDCELVVEFRPKPRIEAKPRPWLVIQRLQRLFRDQSLSELHLRKNPRWVVERVLEHGNLNDLHLLVAFLGRDSFLGQVAEARFSSDRTRQFWQQLLTREGITCTRRSSPEEPAPSWKSSSR
jgi:transcriptional regulator with XRE-family HTH domain